MRQLLIYAASALDDAGKLLVLLRDGRKLMGTLRSFDQFGIHLFLCHSPTFMILLLGERLKVCFIRCGYTANAVLEGACERVIVGEQYCDIPLGLYVIRGENVVLIGELVRLLIALYNSVISLCDFQFTDLVFNDVVGHRERGASSTYDSRLRDRD